MRFSVALLLVAGLASGTKMEAKNQSADHARLGPGPKGPPHSAEAYPGYFDYPGHKKADYKNPYEGFLPSADFNKAVYNFDENKAVFDQKTYEARVRAEAELMIALESLKESVRHLDVDFRTVKEVTQVQKGSIIANMKEAEDRIERLRNEFTNNVHRLDGLFGECHLTQKDLDQAKKALVLYCQQFAFDHDMVKPCSRLLDGHQSLLSYKYKFSGKQTIDQFH